MTTLTEFLLARIADTETAVRDDDYSWLTRHAASLSMDVILAECEAKRRIVEMWSVRNDQSDHPAIGAHATGLGLAIRALATVYADHPDYDEAWRP